jgi:hypothetical protein
LSPEAKHTVEMLLKEAETSECDMANQKLSGSRNSSSATMKSEISNR